MKRIFNIGLFSILVLVLAASCGGGKADNNGKKTKTVVIGEQEWMAENLNVNVFRDGSEIENIHYDDDWSDVHKDKEPAWCYYGFDEEEGAKYGKLYNWYAVNDPRGLCPEGWRVPTDADWQQLIDFLGGKEAAYDKMKSTSGWANDDNGTNESGFNAKPAGIVDIGGEFGLEGSGTIWWASDPVGIKNAQTRFIYPGYRFIYRDPLSRGQGHSVRCIKDK
ncbi:MAG: hypothetical protein A2X19_09690 [Bacteroidetes bacterium GWE2_39_28]|nr:MAG: hypothetical protein A2X19_09690 [Bacteroidetes bacterium GWE2_39_28]OFZ07724.1 MAG: hypothetical protein A2322_00440 [Bacteroidetes bacterium RIFOXYB2_FULL_39_7]OFZ11989.1 MAG: hypothetical protein A2465_08545 [Bacteroidetes bacterium RIFOXYC2_FULL_39_11]HCT95028.1 hypothetical protein [Rikenellaceae bacterium]